MRDHVKHGHEHFHRKPNDVALNREKIHGPRDLFFNALKGTLFCVSYLRHILLTVSSLDV